MTETKIQVKGMEVLTRELGLVEAERFIALMLREPFDYTEWRNENVFPGLTVEQIHDLAAKEAQNGN